MNMDVDYMIHKNRIQTHLQEAAKAAAHSKKSKNESTKTGNNKITIVLASIIKMVIPTK
jgi:hypothetical protein